MDTSSAFVKSVYLQGKNTGKEESTALKLDVVICSPLTLAVGFTLTQDLVGVSGSTETILSSAYLGSITGDCTMDIFELVESLVTDSNGDVISYTPNTNG